MLMPCCALVRCIHASVLMPTSDSVQMPSYIHQGLSPCSNSCCTACADTAHCNVVFNAVYPLQRSCWMDACQRQRMCTPLASRCGSCTLAGVRLKAFLVSCWGIKSPRWVDFTLAHKETSYIILMY